jgi:hypothetical protein
LQKIEIPSSVQKIDGSAFMYSGIHLIEVARHSSNFRTGGPFLLDSNGGLVRYFGLQSAVTISREIVGPRRSCFSGRAQVDRLLFESESTLTEGDDFAFEDCSGLRSIDLPMSLVNVHGSAFAKSKHLHISVDPGNRRLRVIGDFLIEIAQSRFTRYFGSSSTIILSRSVEVIGSYCFFRLHRSHESGF